MVLLSFSILSGALGIRKPLTSYLLIYFYQIALCSTTSIAQYHHTNINYNPTPNIYISIHSYTYAYTCGIYVRHVRAAGGGSGYFKHRRGGKGGGGGFVEVLMYVEPYDVLEIVVGSGGGGGANGTESKSNLKS